MNDASFLDYVDGFRTGKFVVIGDFCLDLEMEIQDEPCFYNNYSVDKRYPVLQKKCSVGGAGNVAKHLLSLGASVTCLGFVGDDSDGREIIHQLAGMGADVSALNVEPNYRTDSYLRLRKHLDKENKEIVEYIVSDMITSSHRDEVIYRQLMDYIDKVDAVIVIDMQVKESSGTLSKSLRNKVSSIAEQYSDKWFLVDSRNHLCQYSHMILKCNLYEFNMLKQTGQYCGADETLNERAKGVLVETKARGLIVTLDKNGILYFDQNGSSTLCPAIEVPHIDSCGAGDAATCGILLGLYSKLPINDVLFLGNIMAAYTVQQAGTGVLKPGLIKELLCMKYEQTKEYQTV